MLLVIALSVWSLYTIYGFYLSIQITCQRTERSAGWVSCSGICSPGFSLRLNMGVRIFLDLFQYLTALFFQIARRLWITCHNASVVRSHLFGYYMPQCISGEITFVRLKGTELIVSYNARLWITCHNTSVVRSHQFGWRDITRCYLRYISGEITSVQLKGTELIVTYKARLWITWHNASLVRSHLFGFGWREKSSLLPTMHEWWDHIYSIEWDRTHCYLNSLKYWYKSVWF
jgi:hypothetical protein